MIMCGLDNVCKMGCYNICNIPEFVVFSDTII